MSVTERTRRLRLGRAIRTIVTIAIVVFGVIHPGRASAASVGGDPAAGHVLGGTTSQQWPVIVTVSRNGKSIAAEIALDMACSSGAQPTLPDGWRSVPVRAGGSVYASGAIPPYRSITGGSDMISGRLDRKHATFSGVWDLHLNFASNGQSDSCDSGRVSFHVRL